MISIRHVGVKVAALSVPLLSEQNVIELELFGGGSLELFGGGVLNLF